MNNVPYLRLNLCVDFACVLCLAIFTSSHAWLVGNDVDHVITERHSRPFTDNDSKPDIKNREVGITLKQNGSEVRNIQPRLGTKDVSPPIPVHLAFSGTSPLPGTEIMMTSTQQMHTDQETDVSSPMITSAPMTTTSAMQTDLSTAASREATTVAGTEVAMTTILTTTEEAETDVTSPRATFFSTPTPDQSTTSLETTVFPTTSAIGTETFTTSGLSTTDDIQTDQTTERATSTPTMHFTLDTSTTIVTEVTSSPGTERMTSVIPTGTTADMETDQTTTQTTVTSTTQFTTETSTPTSPIATSAELTTMATIPETTEDVGTDVPSPVATTAPMETTSAAPREPTTVAGTEVAMTTMLTTTAGAETDVTSPRATVYSTPTDSPTTSAIGTETFTTSELSTTEGMETDQTTIRATSLPQSTSSPGSTSPVSTTTPLETTERSTTTTKQSTTPVRTTLANVIGPLPEDEPAEYPEGESPDKTYYYNMVLTYDTDVSEEQVENDVKEIFCPYYEGFDEQAFVDCYATSVNFTTDEPTTRLRASAAASEQNVSVSYDVIYNATSEAASLEADEIYVQCGLKEDLDNGTVEGNFTVAQQPCETGCGEKPVDWCDGAVCSPDFTPVDDGSSCVCESNCKHQYCLNEGLCEHPAEGISCTCRSGNGWTYVGDQCERIWYYGYTALAIGCVLLMAIVGIAIYCCYSRRRKKDVERMVEGDDARVEEFTFASPLYGTHPFTIFNEGFETAEGEETRAKEVAEAMILERTWVGNRKNAKDSSTDEHSVGPPSVDTSEISTDSGARGEFAAHNIWSEGLPETSFQTPESDSRTSVAATDKDSVGGTFSFPDDSDRVRVWNPTVEHIDPDIEIRILRPSIILAAPYPGQLDGVDNIDMESYF